MTDQTPQGAFNALELLFHAARTSPELRQAVETIRRALEAAADEAEAWEAIRDWHKRDGRRDAHLLPYLVKKGAEIWQMVADAPNRFPYHFDGATRLEALQACAQWVKEQEQHG